MRAAMTRFRLKGTTAVVTTAVMAVVLTACGGDEGKDRSDDKARTTPAATGQKSDAPVDETDSSEVVATIKDASGVEVLVNSVKRESGGFVTVKGQVKNGSSKIWTAPAWQGSEQELANNGASMAGSSLVDQAGKKRYLVLRDTDGRCLCTKFAGLSPGGVTSFFAQFPAPPQTTTEVDFQIPTMPTATIQISG